MTSRLPTLFAGLVAGVALATATGALAQYFVPNFGAVGVRPGWELSVVCVDAAGLMRDGVPGVARTSNQGSRGAVQAVTVVACPA